MRAAWSLVVLRWRRGGGRHRAVLALTAAGVLASVVLALLAVSVGPALDLRADRIAWRDPAQDPVAGREAAARVVERTTTEEAAGRPVTRVDLAALPAPAGAIEAPPVPPGLDAFPAPGEVAVSPAMAALLRRLPADELADRYPGRVVATIGAEGLAHAEELVVVVGRRAADLPAVAATDGGLPLDTGYRHGGGVGVTAFATAGHDERLAEYGTLARTAAVLLVVPTVLLLGAAARLAAAEREQRLTTLRLVGASTWTVSVMTAVEIAAAAVVGAVAGTALYLAVLPIAAHVPLAGGPFSTADLRLPAAALATVIGGLALGAALAAVVALRRLAIGPLGVGRRLPARRPSALRFLVIPVAWWFFLTSAAAMRSGGDSFGVLLGLGAVVATLGVLGPWVTWTIGAVLARTARRAGPLVAGRRIADDPRGAYRSVAGMVLAGLIVGFLLGVVPTIRDASLDGRERRTLLVSVPPERLAGVRAAVAAADPAADVSGGVVDEVGEDDGSGATSGDLFVEASSAAVVDRVRTAVATAAPSATVDSMGDDGRTRLLLDDLGRASGVVGLAALFLAVASTAIASVASVLDQRTTLARLRLLGTPIGVLQRARRWQVVLPLLLATAGALAMGTAAGLVLLLAFGATPAMIVVPDVGPMVGLVAAAGLAGAGVVAATRPVLLAATRTTRGG